MRGKKGRRDEEKGERERESSNIPQISPNSLTGLPRVQVYSQCTVKSLESIEMLLE